MVASGNSILLLLALIANFADFSDECLNSGVCGGSSYCASPPASSCQPSSCQPGYSCGQYGCARNRARSALTKKIDGIFIDNIDTITTKDGDLYIEKKIKNLPPSSARSRGSGKERNIFGLRRSRFETTEQPEETIKQKWGSREATSFIGNYSVPELTNPNYIFRQCCEQRRLPDACLNKCNFNAFTKDSLQAMYFKTDACPLEAAADMQFCAAQGLDHSSCCARNGVTTTLAGNKCLTFCDQRADRITKLDYSYVPCYDKFEEMKRCFYYTIKEKAESQYRRR